MRALHAVRMKANTHAHKKQYRKDTQNLPSQNNGLVRALHTSPAQACEVSANADSASTDEGDGETLPVCVMERVWRVS